MIPGFVVTLNSYQGVPVPVLVLLVILGVFTVVGDQTVFGRRIYAVGSNMEATRLSGVNVNLVKLMVFGMMGLMCAFAGLTTTARLAAGILGELRTRSMPFPNCFNEEFRPRRRGNGSGSAAAGRRHHHGGSP